MTRRWRPWTTAGHDFSKQIAPSNWLSGMSGKLSSYQKQMRLLKEMDNYGPDVLALSEVGWIGAAKPNLDMGYTVLLFLTP